jgi:hypothetical protein
MKEMTAIITIQVKDGKFYASLKNDGFEYYELVGILHEIITQGTLIKIAEEELKQTEKLTL